MTYNLDALAIKIHQTPTRCGAVKIVTIDGPAGSGKTTLAQKLAPHLGNAQIVAMDSLYDGWENALHPSLWERIHESIVVPLSQGKSANFQMYNWHTNRFELFNTIGPNGIVIVEGVGAGHPRIAKVSSYNIWISGPAHRLLERVLQRDGQHIREQMLAWQLAERAYFAEFDVASRADMHLTTGTSDAHSDAAHIT